MSGPAPVANSRSTTTTDSLDEADTNGETDAGHMYSQLLPADLRTGAGILLVCIFNEEPYVLLALNTESDKWSDFGGKKGPHQATHLEIACAELTQQTSGSLSMTPSALSAAVRHDQATPFPLGRRSGDQHSPADVTSTAYVCFVVPWQCGTATLGHASIHDLTTALTSRLREGDGGSHTSRIVAISVGTFRNMLLGDDAEDQDMDEVDATGTLRDHLYRLGGRLAEALGSIVQCGKYVPCESLTCVVGVSSAGDERQIWQHCVTQPTLARILSSLMQHVPAGKGMLAVRVVVQHKLLMALARDDSKQPSVSFEEIGAAASVAGCHGEAIVSGWKSVPPSSLALAGGGGGEGEGLTLEPSQALIELLTALVRDKAQQMARRAMSRRIKSEDDMRKHASPALRPSVPQPHSTPPYTELQPGSPSYAELLRLAEIREFPHRPKVYQVNMPARRSGFRAYHEANNSIVLTAFYGCVSIDEALILAEDGPDVSLATDDVIEGFFALCLPSVVSEDICLVLSIAPGHAYQGVPHTRTLAALQAHGCGSVQTNIGFYLVHKEQVCVDYLIVKDPSSCETFPDALQPPPEESRASELWRAWHQAERRRQGHANKAASNKDIYSACEQEVQDILAQVDGAASSGGGGGLMQQARLLGGLWRRLEWADKHYLVQSFPAMRKKTEFDAFMNHSSRNVCVITAATGIGKTVVVPQWTLSWLQTHRPSALTGPEKGSKKRVVVLVPRRELAKEQSRFVAELRGVGHGPGGEVGYAIGSHPYYDNETSLLYATSGYFWRLTSSSSPQQLAADWAAVIVDEVHERCPQSDMVIHKLRSLKYELGDDAPVVILLSATIDIDSYRSFFEESDVPFSAMEWQDMDTVFPVDVQYMPIPEVKACEKTRDELQKQGYFHGFAQAVVQAIRKAPALVDSTHTTPSRRAPRRGCLVFVATRPQAETLCVALQLALRQEKDLFAEVMPFHAGMDSLDKQQVFEEGPTQSGSGQAWRIVVATTIAESGLTLPHLELVVDSGRKFVNAFDPSRQMFIRGFQWISKASAVQRAGRAGRLKPGTSVRLFSETQLENFQMYDDPDISQCDPSQFLISELGARGPGGRLPHAHRADLCQTPLQHPSRRPVDDAQVPGRLGNGDAGHPYGHHCPQRAGQEHPQPPRRPPMGRLHPLRTLTRLPVAHGEGGLPRRPTFVRPVPQDRQATPRQRLELRRRREGPGGLRDRPGTLRVVGRRQGLRRAARRPRG
mmetsp:Transcript_6522/g.18834  ORF Transcript_6522/g.18834 Transcript_6522/m.18834 type:complete len:1241 (+) Transcript_6522:302-4024(+)